MNEFDAVFKLALDIPIEVSGRASADVPQVTRDQLARFAAGATTDEEREEIKRLVLEQPELIPFLVEEVKRLRGAKAS
jgi:hypothetical protein